MKPQVNKRLLACASLVRRGAVLADIGTDHGYLPIHLLSEGKISRAVLSDINSGPLSKAEANIRAAGLSDKAELCLCDGASALAGRGITDYCIAGMGGELIASIIDAAPEMKDENVRLVLQPMSKPEELRRYLYSAGFRVERELYVCDDGRYYLCVLARYVGERVAISDTDAHFGRLDAFEPARSSEMLGYMKERESSFKRMIDGKRAGGADVSSDEKLLFDLKERIKTIK